MTDYNDPHAVAKILDPPSLPLLLSAMYWWSNNNANLNDVQYHNNVASTDGEFLSTVTGWWWFVRLGRHKELVYCWLQNIEPIRQRLLTDESGLKFSTYTFVSRDLGYLHNVNVPINCKQIAANFISQKY